MFKIVNENGKYAVYGVEDNGAVFLTQTFNPFNGKGFASIDECMEFLKLVMGASEEQIEIAEE